ncbi:hypothetical protein JL720_9865 [Aureococcus anophagefferens]|nr:hypothetical protein JL720_9865 [Aureococcus anophagefferens]
MAAVKRSAVVVLLLAAASAEPLKSLGDTLTDEAIGLAGQGRMQEALERFFDAREAEPQDSRRWQNVGVTLMRMGHLEDARASLEEAIRLAPGDATCVANLEALSQHEAHRDRERGQPPPPPARSAAPKPPPTIFPGGATKKELLARAEAHRRARRRRRLAGSLVARPGRAADADGGAPQPARPARRPGADPRVPRRRRRRDLAGEMAASEQWSPVQGFSRFYQFHFLMLDSNADNYWKANATVLHAMHGLFNSRHLKAWAAELLSAADYFDAVDDTPARFKRLAYSGWFNSNRPHLDDRADLNRRSKKDDQDLREAKGLVVDGGRVLSFEEPYNALSPTLRWSHMRG